MNFFGMGPMEIGVILVIALIIFGPGKLPEIGATIGKSIRDFRAATGDLTGEFQRALNDLDEAKAEVTQSARDVQQTTQSALADVRLDQAPTPATMPSNPAVQKPALGAAPPAPPQRTPTKADPLADLMPFEFAPASPTSNGHTGRDGTGNPNGASGA